MLALLLLTLLIFTGLLALIYLLSLSPANTICPKCKKKKRPKEHGWKMLCLKCEGGENE